MKTYIFTLFLVLSFSLSLFSQVVNDPYFSNQWYLNMVGDENTRADIRVLDAWARTMGSSFKIADIESDEGAYPNTFHEDLIDRVTLQNLLKNKKLTLFVLMLFLMQRYTCNTIEPIDDFKLKGIIYTETLDSVNFRETIRMEKKSILCFGTK